MKKGLLVGLGIVLILITLPFLFLKLAFGPVHNSFTIDLGKEGELFCEETYHGDFAGEFYDVKMVLKTLGGRRYDCGSVTFHDKKWQEQIKAKRTEDWLSFPLNPGDLAQVKTINTVTGQLNDTILIPFDLRRDILFKQKFKHEIDRLYTGSSKILNVSDTAIEVIYEYKAKAEYPSQILLSQHVIYNVNKSSGKLLTKVVHDMVVM